MESLAIVMKSWGALGSQAGSLHAEPLLLLERLKPLPLETGAIPGPAACEPDAHMVLRTEQRESKSQGSGYGMY